MKQKGQYFLVFNIGYKGTAWLGNCQDGRELLDAPFVVIAVADFEVICCCCCLQKPCDGWDKAFEASCLDSLLEDNSAAEADWGNFEHQWPQDMVGCHCCFELDLTSLAFWKTDCSAVDKHCFACSGRGENILNRGSAEFHKAQGFA